jgi:ubiquinone/menaquinone biosynthesis C-methylase UbiE
LKAVTLVCPDCRKTTDYNGSVTKLTCFCSYKFNLVNGIISFVPKDAFYEGKFDLVRVRRHGFVKKFYSKLSVSAIEYRTWERSRKIIRAKLPDYGRLKILNLAAGGGNAFLNEMGTVVSLDLSFKSLLGAKTVSDFCVQADATRLPFSDNYFDLVFSSHFLGHLPLAVKDDCIREIYRVTKLAGFTLHSAETDADNFTFKAAKHYPDLYEKNFVEMYGHHSLELFTDLVKRFRKYPFKPVFEEPDYCVGLIRQVNSYRIFFDDPEFRRKSGLFKILFNLSGIACRVKPVSLALNILLRPLTLINRLFGRNPFDSAKLMYVKA